MTNSSHISELMKHLVDRRKALGLSQSQVADMLEFAKASGAIQVSRFEKGKRVPSLDLLRHWGEALGLKLEWQPKILAQETTRPDCNQLQSTSQEAEE